ncbi:MAG: PadR family transcriptional regulator [Thermoanaerobaculia bacterium]|nr:PadR family transcriptional regulator [Thermoanaerobaculia bacterium]
MTSRTLKSREFHVLVALADEPLHGYQMAQRMEEDSEGRMRIMPGNLYAILQRLTDEGLIQPLARSPRGPSDDSRRRYFELTPAGRRALASEGLRLERLSARLRSRRLLDLDGEEAAP